MRLPRGPVSSRPFTVSAHYITCSIPATKARPEPIEVPCFVWSSPRAKVSVTYLSSHLNPHKIEWRSEVAEEATPGTARLTPGSGSGSRPSSIQYPPAPSLAWPPSSSLFHYSPGFISCKRVVEFARPLTTEDRKMSSLDATRAELGLVVLYLNKAEARDKICRAIQYGSKFISNGQPGTAQDVDKSTTLARKVFRLLKWVNDLHALISPPAKGTPLTLVLLGKSKNALLSMFLFLDQFVWLGRTGIVKNKEATDRVGRISLYCWMASSVCAGLVELGELKRLSRSMRKLARELRNTDKYENEQYQNKMKQSDERLLALVKAAMDVVVAIGLLQLAPKVTPRVTGAFGFITSLISCYQARPWTRASGAAAQGPQLARPPTPATMQ